MAGDHRVLERRKQLSSVGSRLFSAAGRVLSHPSMRPVTRTFSDLHAALYRITGGAAQNPNYPTMLLTVIGRKTGKPRTVPLIYLEDGERLVIAAAYAGSEVNPTWWLNLRDNPEAVAQLRNQTIRVHAALAERRGAGAIVATPGGRCIRTSPSTRRGLTGRYPWWC